MAEKVLEKDLMTDAELDNITGGATGYIYYKSDTQDGYSGYSALKVTGSLSKKEVLDTYSRTRDVNIHNLRDGEDGRFFVRDRDAQMVINEMSKRGYNFIDFNKMR